MNAQSGLAGPATNILNSMGIDPLVRAFTFSYDAPWSVPFPNRVQSAKRIPQSSFRPPQGNDMEIL